MPVSITYEQVPAPALASYVYVVESLVRDEMRARPQGTSVCVTTSLMEKTAFCSMYSTYLQ